MNHVQIDPNLRIDDRFAASLVTKMLTELHNRVNHILVFKGDKDNRASLGNPKGQKRFFDRLIERNRFGLLAAAVEYGNRCKFRAMFDLWDASSSNDDSFGNGPLSWLTSVRIDIKGNGPRHKLEHDMMELVAISRHALERLVQRGHVRNSETFILLLKRAWSPLSLAMASADALPKDGHTSWVVPVEIPGRGDVYLIVSRNVKGKGPILMVTSAFTEDMIVAPQALVPLRDLLKSYEGSSDFTPLVSDPRLVPALVETAKATRRGRIL